eukprot:Gregarina_sp_Poly_1__173@NODE_103_length_14370_cov_80_074250_g90_i0_p3_GENE_NODE_103_length_14370_cov_80_074250_g90_i0NODE_103_length_14370_cov_80_074250_g90_i0_p3_ORF_typecomplete_len674_score92_73AMPbinding/PF00501_28/3_8e52AMPbinding/PF00501_28/1_3e06AMPbinding_C/PF13193_6/2_5e11_NODE_103_length_14370_cov_80_074250_g90_i014963517
MLHLGDAFGFTDLKSEGDKPAVSLECETPTLIDMQDERLRFTPRQIVEVTRATAVEIFSVFFHHLESSTTLSVVQKSIAIVMPNSAGLLFSVLAVSGLSMIACPMYSTLSTHEYKFAFRDMSVDLLIVGENGNPGAEEAARDLGIPSACFTWIFDNLVPVPYLALAHEDKALVAEQLNISPKEFEVCIKFHTAGVTARPKLVPLTHRNVVLSLANVQKTYAWHGYSGGMCESEDMDVGLCVCNMTHVHGLVVGCLAPLACQSIVVICEELVSPKDFWQACINHRVTWVTLLPSILHTLLNQYENSYPKENSPLLRFIRTTSSNLPPDIALEAEKKFSCPLIEAYSLTEAAHQICSNGYPTLDDRKLGSVGKPTGTEVAILDSVNVRRCCKLGEVGEIWIRGWNVVDSYEKMPTDQQQEEFLSHNEIDWSSAGGAPAYFSSAFDLLPGVHRSFSSLRSDTARASRSRAHGSLVHSLPVELIPPDAPPPETQSPNLIRFSSALEPYVASDFPQRREPLISPLPLPIQWLRTGDTGRMDADGWLYLIARSKDIINRGGLKLSPKEVEDVFSAYPEVERCAVFGVKHPTLGEAVHMALIPKEHVIMTTTLQRDLLKRCTSKLAYFKVPEKLHIVKALPVDLDGRLMRDRLSQEFSLPPPLVTPLASPIAVTPFSSRD